MDSLKVSLLSAFGAGIISFFTPCILPLVPAYLLQMVGVSLEEGEEMGARRFLLPAFLFVLGFTMVFVSLGASASALGQWLQRRLPILIPIGGGLVILVGVLFLWELPSRWLRTYSVPLKVPRGVVGSWVLGAAFALTFTPCIGPVLGSILVLASSTQTVGEGALLLFVYSLGMGIPFLLAAIFFVPFRRFLIRFRPYFPWVERAVGMLLIFIGILMLTGTYGRWVGKLLAL